MRLLLHLLQMNLKTMLALRGAFLLRLFFTSINHTVYLVIWIMFFRQVVNVGAWSYPHLLLAYGIGLWAWGFSLFFTYGFRLLPRSVAQGELDTLLLQPKPLLLLLANSHHEPIGLIDIILGSVFIAVAAHWIPLHPLLLAAGIFCACVTLAAFCLAVGSLAFWMQDVLDWALDLQFNTFIFATRPAPAFHGLIRVAMFTVLPVAYMTLLPVELLRRGDIRLLLPLVAGTTLCAAAAWMVFQAGLRRYASGNSFTVRA